jgi:hypothetical protein
MYRITLPRVCVTSEGAWIGNPSYLKLTQLATSSINNSSWIYTAYNSLGYELILLNLLSSVIFYGNGFQRLTFPFLWIF